VPARISLGRRRFFYVMEKGWIKIHRSIIDWEWASDSSTFAFWVKLLLLVNFEDKKWKGLIIKAGQIVTSHEKLSDATGLSKSTIKRYLNLLKQTGEISLESKPGKGTILTVLKYKNYQFEERYTTTDHNSDRNSDHNSDHNRDHNRDLLLKKEKNKRKKRTTGGTNPPDVSLPEELSFSTPEGSQIEQKMDSLSRWEKVLSVWKSSEPDYVLKATRDKYWMKKSKEFQEEMVTYLEGLGPKAVHLQTLWIGPMFKNNLFHPGQIQTEIDKKESQTKTKTQNSVIHGLPDFNEIAKNYQK
jgi:biotin operon repressor